MTIRYLLASVLCVLLSRAVDAGIVLIDDFSDGTQNLSATGGNTDNDSVAATVIGGERDASITGISGGTSRLDIADPVEDGGLGLTLYQESSQGDAMFSIVWDGTDGSDAINYTGLGGADLTDSGTNDGILLENVASDTGSILTLTIYTSAGLSSTADVAIPVGLIATNLFIKFTDFVGTANFSNVGAIVLSGDVSGMTNGTDIDLDGIYATTSVPEPTSMAIMGLGTLLAGFGVRRRKRKMAEMAA